MKSNIVLKLILIAVVLITTCKKDNQQPIPAHVVPPVKSTKLDFRGYVTDAKFDLTSQIYNFTRYYAGADTINGTPVHIYLSNNVRTPYYTDKNGDMWEYQTENLSARLMNYNLKTEASVLIQYWKALLKTSKGKKTTWDILVDTTFNAFDAKGNTQKIQYYHYGKARYDGWSKITVHERRDEDYNCMMTYWPELNTFIINRTTGDTLFAQKGKARQMIDPAIGAIKYMIDYTLQEKNGELTISKSTWELTSKYIP